MQQIEDGILPAGIPLIARRKVDQELLRGLVGLDGATDDVTWQRHTINRRSGWDMGGCGRRRACWRGKGRGSRRRDGLFSRLAGSKPANGEHERDMEMTQGEPVRRKMRSERQKSGCRDLNPGPLAPKASALPPALHPGRSEL